MENACVQSLLKDLMLHEYYQALCGSVINRFTCFQTKDYLFGTSLVVFVLDGGGGGVGGCAFFFFFFF